VVAAWQLLQLGLSYAAISKRRTAGLLHRIYHGVYSVGHRRLTVDGRRMAAVLAGGPGAALGHHSAGAAWGLLRTTRTRFDVIRPGRGTLHRAGLHVHRTRRLPPADLTTLRGIPITTVARTLLDLGAVLDAHRLERAIHEAEVLGLLDMREIEATIARNNGHRGVGCLRAALAQPSPGTTRTELEDRFLGLCRRAGLPLPALNARIVTPEGTFEVDALWPAEKLIVELDGGAAHRTRRAFEDDRRRDAALAAAGYLVVRLTWRRVTEDAGEVARQLRRILALRR
jgi:hypothetical protein